VGKKTVIPSLFTLEKRGNRLDGSVGEGYQLWSLTKGGKHKAEYGGILSRALEQARPVGGGRVNRENGGDFSGGLGREVLLRVVQRTGRRRLIAGIGLKEKAGTPPGKSIDWKRRVVNTTKENSGQGGEA